MAKKLSAGSLPFVIALSLVIAIVLSGMLLILMHSRNQSATLLSQERLQRNINSALTIAMTGNEIAVGDSINTDLYQEGTDSVKLSKKSFGIYYSIQVEAFDELNSGKKAALIGSRLRPAEKYALYLANEDRPLSVSGNTSIKGNAFLPEAGTRKAYIEGQSYQGGKVVDGSVFNSTSLPALDNTITARLFPFLNDEDSTQTFLDQYDIVSFDDSISNSFFDDTQLVLFQDSILRGTIQGNIILYAQKPLTLSRESTLKDVLIFAPSIRTEDGFTGQAQLFAKDSITIGKNCSLEYPSAIGLLRKKEESLPETVQPYIRIMPDAVVNGAVFCHYIGAEELLGLIRIDQGAIINGQVHADGLLQLQGKVNGITQCRRFTLRTASTLYENFVLNGKMDFNALSRHYVGNPLMNKGDTYSIIKWLE